LTFDEANFSRRVLAHIAPRRADRGLPKELDKLQDMVEKLQRSSEANRQLQPSHTEATLMQCAREVIVKGTTMYEASLAAESVAGGQGAANSNIRVAEWVSTLESIRREQRLSDPSDMVSNVPSVFSGDGAHTVVTSATSAQRAVQEREAVDAAWDDSDDDLDTDLAKAALETGTKAFEAQDWEEADSLFQEALRVLQQLPKQQRAFCDIFGLQYKLALCAYHTQEPVDAEEALMSLVQQSASSDEQRGYIYNAAHLLSHLYIRMGQVDRARSECEKALQARRRLLGKRSDASLESTALMAHIYGLLNNRARAKSCLAMIPEARRDAVLKIVEQSLGTNVERLDSSSPLTRSISEDSDLAVKRIQSRLSTAPPELPMENRCYGPVSAIISQSPAASLRHSHHRIPANKASLEDLHSVTVTSLLSVEERRESRATGKERANEDYSAEPEILDAAALSPGEPLEANETFKSKILSRKEILDKIGCQPRDRIEEAVCDGDHLSFASLLNRKKDFWRSKLRRRVRPERVTALHFAALFGEMDMARRLLDSSFNINEVPYGYTKSLTPLKFAIGARQVDMVEFLIACGAKPSAPDSWSTLAGQLMNRSWLMKTMSESEKEDVPNRIIAILRILLKHRWDVNSPFETSGRTVLHQAVTFWTGAYRWDLNLRAAVTSFLCERGADPFQANIEGRTPYDMASASGHQDLLLLLGRGSKMKEPEDWPAEPVELSSELRGMV
jgi:tetratricopeptide (TPR) repeat protein